MGLFRSSSTSPSKHTSPARSEGDTSEVNHTHGVGRHGHNHHGGSLHRKGHMLGMSSPYSSEADTTVAPKEIPTPLYQQSTASHRLQSILEATTGSLRWCGISSVTFTFTFTISLNDQCA